MNLVVVVPPPVEPVTDELVFAHLRLDVGMGEELAQHPDYLMIKSQITASREKAEQIMRRSFVQQTLRLISDGLPRAGGWPGSSRQCGAFELPRPPFISLSSVSYYDSANALQTIDPASYFVSDDLVPELHFVDGFSAPSTYRRSDAVRVEYVAGYAPVPGAGEDPPDYRANVPEFIKQAILLGVQLQYDELTPDKRAALERARDALLEGQRIHKF